MLIVTIFSFRKGIYDFLPEGLFHPPSLGTQKSGIKEVIEQIRKQKRNEIDARNFFQPFELESFYLLLNAYNKENEFQITENSESLLIASGILAVIGYVR